MDNTVARSSVGWKTYDYTLLTDKRVSNFTINDQQIPANSQSQDKHTEKWVKRLGSVQLPVLSGVMKELNAVTQSDDSCVSQLSEIILKDSA